jgi:hypothetical protein
MFRTNAVEHAFAVRHTLSKTIKQMRRFEFPRPTIDHFMNIVIDETQTDLMLR